jgi:hypothetical protein
MNKQHLIIDFGPSTLLLLCEMVLIVLKLTGHLTISWTIALLPIILVVMGTAVIIFVTFLKIIKNHLF